MPAQRLRSSSRRPALAAGIVATACSVLAPRATHGSARQINIGPTLGASLQIREPFSPGPSAGVLFGYGITDAFRYYAALDYALTFNPSMPASVEGPRHTLALGTGVLYTLDVTTVVPWFGLGINAAFTAQRDGAAFTFGPEARGGADIHFSRYFGMNLQVAYALVLLDRDPSTMSHTLRISHVVGINAGLRFVLDL